MLTYPYQANVVPVGCYCQQGYSPDCASIPAQTLEQRAEFYKDWEAAQREPRLAHFAAQHFAFRWGWRVRDTVTELLRQRSPALLPYLESVAQRRMQPTAESIYNAMLYRVF